MGHPVQYLHRYNILSGCLSEVEHPGLTQNVLRRAFCAPYSGIHWRCGRSFLIPEPALCQSLKREGRSSFFNRSFWCASGNFIFHVYLLQIFLLRWKTCCIVYLCVTFQTFPICTIQKQARNVQSKVRHFLSQRHLRLRFKEATQDLLYLINARQKTPWLCGSSMGVPSGLLF